jgi:hypothetical protein
MSGIILLIIVVFFLILCFAAEFEETLKGVGTFAVALIIIFALMYINNDILSGIFALAFIIAIIYGTYKAKGDDKSDDYINY